MTIAWITLLCEGFITFIIKYLINDNKSSMQEFSVIIILIHVIIFIFSIYSSKIDNKLKNIIVLSIIFRLLLMIWDNIGRDILPFPDSLDTYTFIGTASRLYNKTGSGRGGIYSQFIAYFVYGIFGEQPLIAQYLNILISITTIFMTYKTAILLNIKSNVIYMSIFIMCFLPYLAIDDSLILREASIQMLLACSIYFFYTWLKLKYNKRLYLLFAFSLTLIASSLHSGAIAITITFIIWILLYNKNNDKIMLTLKNISMSLFVFSTFLVIYKYTGNTFSQKFGNTDNIIDIVSIASSHEAGGSAYSIGTTATSIPLLIAYTPLRMFYFIASPVPWMWRGIQDVISFIFSSLFYLYTIYISINAIMNKNSTNRTIIILFLLAVIIGAIVFAWGVSNAGAALRHRDKFISIFILLFALCKDNNFDMKKQVNHYKIL